MIQTTLTGRLGKPAEVRQAGTTQVVNFTVAVDIGYGDKKHTLWVECAKFGNNTKVAEYLVKGQKVLLVGEPDLRIWESNGKNGATMTLNVSTIELIGNREGQQQGAPQSQTYTPQAAYNTQPSYQSANQFTEPEDELPF